MNLERYLDDLKEEQGAIGWLIIGIIIGVVLVIWLIVRIIGGIF